MEKGHEPPWGVFPHCLWHLFSRWYFQTNMFGRGLTLFRLLGFRVRVDWSWIIIAALVTWSLGRGVFPAYIEGLPAGTYWWMAAAGAIAFFICIILHEFGHSVVARAYGIPMQGITLFVFGGVAEMGAEPRSAISEFWMAVAGPITSLILAGIFYGLRRLSDAWQWPVQAMGIFTYLYWVNLALVAFNIIPAFPLDGGRVLRSILWGASKNLAWATRVASFIGTVFGILLVLLGILAFVFGNFIAGVWWFIIGLFIRRASQISYQQVVVGRALEGVPVRRFMNSNPVTVSPSTSIKDLVENFVYRYHFKMFPVVQDGHLVGCVTLNQVKQVPREEWETRTAENLAVPCSGENTVTPDTDAVNALSTMRQKQVTRLMVVDQDHLVGVISLRDLLNFLSLRAELEGA